MARNNNYARKQRRAAARSPQTTLPQLYSAAYLFLDSWLQYLCTSVEQIDRMYTANARRTTDRAVCGGDGLYRPGLVQYQGTRQVVRSFGPQRRWHRGARLQTVEVLPGGSLRVCALLHTLDTVVGMTHTDQHTFVLVPEQLPAGGYLYCAAEEYCRRLWSIPMVKPPTPPTEPPPAKTANAARTTGYVAPRLPVPLPAVAKQLQRAVAKQWPELYL